MTATSAVPKELWPTLFEKTMGGYASIDGSFAPDNLYLLSGWIAECIDFDKLQKNMRRSIDQLWSDILQLLRDRKAVACLATPASSDRQVESAIGNTGLLSQHAYSVLEAAEVDGNKLMFIRNPHRQTRWKGKFSPSDRLSWTHRMKDELQYDPQKHQNDDGCFWMEWKDISTHFDGISLAYDPSIFPHRVDVHSCFDPTGQAAFVSSARRVSAFSPQFVLELKPTKDDLCLSEVEVWVQLHRHISAADHVKEEKEKKISITTHVFEGGDRVQLIDGERWSKLSMATYMMIKLDKFRLPWRKRDDPVERELSDYNLKYTIVVGQYKRKEAFNFTFSVFSTVKATLHELPPVIPQGWISQYHDGEWTKENAGGCRNHPTFDKNPQYSVITPEDVKAVVLLESQHPHGVAVVQDVFRKIAYTLSFYLQTDTTFKAGENRLTVTTYEPQQLGKYRLSIHTPPLSGSPVYPVVKRVK
ncbi:unnamed protein product [Vitrella brassicaformis CCMP3155]|uniref:Calpain catalytic domain-containing protein n=1 Tax=Vitrella brassicaformis (strain CCMP3155) TaxID=1169540 RepID=A0A0G4GAR9_VITBC|nr:unnamed protein product [Vitrella brassicaformis CCMP3155]|eukprot:CEM25892.1 unnamed protein product [Vitrella brassicaformis CCMP3155]